MGISYKAALIAGLPYTELAVTLSEEALEALDDAIDYGEVDYVSPYYDCDRENQLIGVRIEMAGDYSYTEIQDVDLPAEKEQEIAAFEQRYGVKLKLFLSLHSS